MKKILLFIPALLCLYQVFTGSHAGMQRQLADDASLPKQLYAFAAASYPHTEFEVNYQLTSGNHCRQQSQHSFIGTAEYLPLASHQTFEMAAASFTQPGCKQYLSHIYPTHNFW